MSGVNAGDTWTTLLGGFLVAGVGVGLLNPVIADVALSVVPKERSGMAAGINDTFRQVGVAVGVAVWGAIFIGHGADKVRDLTAGTPTARGRPSAPADGGDVVGRLNQVTAHGSAGGASHGGRTPPARGSSPGSTRCSLSAALVCFAGAVLSLWLVREGEIEREPVEPDIQPESDRVPQATAA